MKCDVPLAEGGGPYTMCQSCFDSPAVRHDSMQFVRVSERGEHSIVERPVPPCKRLRVRREHVRTVSTAELEPSAREAGCVVCCEEFSDDNPAAFLPGCTKQHGFSAPDRRKGR